MAPVDWIKWANKDGQKFVTYDSGVKTANEAAAKGYTNVEKVFDIGNGDSDMGEKFTFEKGGVYTINGGGARNAKNGDTDTTKGGTIINGNKSATGQFAAVLSGSGDGLSAFGAAATASGILAPAGGVLMFAGSILSGGGTALDLVDDYQADSFSYEKAVTKAALTVAPDVIGEAGKGVIRPAEEGMVNGLIMGLDKTLDDGREKKKGPYQEK